MASWAEREAQQRLSEHRIRLNDAEGEVARLKVNLAQAEKHLELQQQIVADYEDLLRFLGIDDGLAE